MLQARDTAHFSSSFNGLNRTFFLTNRTVCWASFVIAIRKTRWGQGGCCNDPSQKESRPVPSVEEQTVLPDFANACRFTRPDKAQITPEVAPPGDMVRKSTIDRHSYCAVLFNDKARLNQ